MKTEDMILKKVLDIPPSGIRKYFDLLNEMKDVISLGVGEPDFTTPWNVSEAGIYSLEKGYTHYSSNAGLLRLREEISHYVKQKYDLEYDPKTQVLVTVGGSEGIDLALRAVAGPGDEVIIPEPSFVAYKGCARLTGASPVIINLRVEDRFKLTPELLKSALTTRTKAVIIPYPNNPTGAVMDRDELTAIARILKDKNLVVISDEIYAELTYNGKHVSIASLEGMKDKTIVINGFSKAFAMTGWRLGYACGHPAFISAMNKIHQYAIMCAPTTAQYAAIEALRNGDTAVDDMVREYNRRRRMLVEGFNKMGLDCFEPLGAFYVFPCIRRTGLTSEEFCEQLLVKEKVLVVPGNAFGEVGEGFVRVSYASSTVNIIEALKRIERFIAKSPSNISA